MAVVHSKTMATHGEPQSRLHWKLRIVRGLYERGFSRQQVLELFRLVDWLMVLPEELTPQLERDLEEIERGTSMPYITSIERLGIERGVLQGLQRGVLNNLATRFGEVPGEIRARVEQVAHEEHLLALQRQAITVASLAEFEQLLHTWDEPEDALPP